MEESFFSSSATTPTGLEPRHKITGEIIGTEIIIGGQLTDSINVLELLINLNLEEFSRLLLLLLLISLLDKESQRVRGWLCSGVLVMIIWSRVMMVSVSSERVV
jgi:hypothetical protein